MGAEVTGIVGFRNKDIVILEDEFRACCDEFIIMTDDGSTASKALVTAAAGAEARSTAPTMMKSSPSAR